MVVNEDASRLGASKMGHMFDGAAVTLVYDVIYKGEQVFYALAGRLCQYDRTVMTRLACGPFVSMLIGGGVWAIEGRVARTFSVSLSEGDKMSW